MTSASKKLISIVVPAFNEEENVRPLWERVSKVIKDLEDRYDFELLFTDNHSTDRTFEILEELSTIDGRISVIRFSKNFGFQRSIMTGYLHARGDAAIQIDCDLQDPPELIKDFIAKWEEGYEVVYGVRRERKEGYWITLLRRIFYQLIDRLSDDHLPHGAGDFRLVSRRILDVLGQVEDSHPYLRGMIASLGYRQTGIVYDRDLRSRGESKFSFGQLVSLAMDGILSHSVIPLRLATATGLFVSIATVVGLAIIVGARLFFGSAWPAGFATITVLILLSLSLNAMFLGIIGEYLGRIYHQVKRRPLTLVERQIVGTNSKKPSNSLEP